MDPARHQGLSEEGRQTPGIVDLHFLIWFSSSNLISFGISAHCLCFARCFSAVPTFKDELADVLP